jgi:hypothetical protein
MPVLLRRFLFAFVLALPGCTITPPVADGRALLGPFQPEGLSADQAAAVVRFAPVILQATSADPDLVHRDVPTAFDYDGNRVGRDNEENLDAARAELPAVVYYAAVETETHRFLTYFLFHPLDWSPIPNVAWSGIWHENDGESIQVVTRKATATEPEQVVLLATQAHLGTSLYGDPEAHPARGGWEPEAPVWLLADAADRADAAGARTHPAVYVESGGHGIYGLEDHKDELVAFDPPRLEHGLVLRPGGFEDGADRRWTPGTSQLRYRLVPLHDTLWRSYVARTDQGDGALMDGTFDYADAEVGYPGLPRHFDSDRLSFLPLWKHDAGIVPFAFSDSLLADDLGALFFHPADKYARELEVPAGWSTRYTYNPYRPADAEAQARAQVGAAARAN